MTVARVPVLDASIQPPTSRFCRLYSFEKANNMNRIMSQVYNALRQSQSSSTSVALANRPGARPIGYMLIAH